MAGDRTPPRLRAALLALPLALLPLLSGACDGDALPWDDDGVHGDGIWHGTRDTLDDGTVVVHNPEQGIWTEEQVWRIEEELRIGAATGQGPEVFARINALAVDSLGRIWVADGQAGELRVFGREGRHVRTVAGEGEGPGELLWPAGLEVTPDGRVVVIDLKNNRYTVYDTAGSLRGDHPRRRPPFSAWPWRSGLVGPGRLVDVAREPGSRRKRRVEVLDEDFEVAETHPFPKRPGDHYAPGRIWTVDPRGFLWFGKEDRYRLVQRRLEGDTVRIVERDVVPRSYSDEEREQMAARARSRRGAVASRDEDGDEGGGITVGDMPEHEPLLRSIWVDDGGRLWVAPHGGGELYVSGFDLFDERGRYVGRVGSGPGLRSMSPHPVVRGKAIWAVTRDSLEVPYVVRGRIVRPDGE